ncbi:hypothetical protein MATR_19720 [Marivirga tractuosa]|uniref:Uncharacterized protein n=1 Tax=Marivirga tractuosa (strain ATCC 23168 / DSM 4126 / NBRC 15989 / NCIMB 1408 / VKM B-1430 / H-43) TaxID=643867 RepID=E4TNF1_MARTH|nr:hypothetical protein [Marivirga tractuosa]ADR20408.1 hypothetical protein Ftrac_0402 [Marivirga tractuosa DSM 4126]BDD15147.1 hypothetical protein MATR_19720 [Marivirga tractuosa]
MKKYGLSLIFSLAFIINLLGQQIEPKGKFLQDSMAIGEPVKYSLSIRYPANFQVLMPDSLYDYAPFEYTSKKFFPTKSDSIQSFDSVVYILTSFEIDKVQNLKLPVFIVEGNDSTAVYAKMDSIYLQEQIQAVSDTLQMKTDAIITRLDKDFNYPYLIAFLIALGIIILLVIIIFGKKLRKKWQVWRLNKRHKKFRISFESKLTAVGEMPVGKIEKLLYTWKKHAEFISKSPYAKLTSKEINQMKQNEELYENLKSIDRTIYSSKGRENATEAFQFLLSYADVILEERIKAIADGK